jgi:hypothetical protein
MNPTALIIAARTRARGLGTTDSRARRLSRLADRLESILATQRRLQGKLQRKGGSA